jgi:hypothetical protein
MLGLGETTEEIASTLAEARAAGVRILYLGQYLQPSTRHLPVARYLEPELFDELGAQARALGFDFVASAPLVRSSYHEAGQAACVRRLLSDVKITGQVERQRENLVDPAVAAAQSGDLGGTTGP